MGESPFHHPGLAHRIRSRIFSRDQRLIRRAIFRRHSLRFAALSHTSQLRAYCRQQAMYLYEGRLTLGPT